MIQMPKITNLAVPQVADDQITLTWDKIENRGQNVWKFVVLMIKGDSRKFK